MNRPPPYHPVVPLHMVQQGYPQYMNLGNTAVAGHTFQAPQLTATDPTIWQVQNHAGAPAFISTRFGRYEKRDMVADHKVTPILRSNVAACVSAKATSLRQAYPELIRYIKKPTFWDDLYFLWDAADIQLEGPEFLYYVMHRLGAENEQLDREYEKAQKNEIDEYARAWVTNHREMVLKSVAGSMYGLFISDPAENDDFAQEWRSILSKALEAHRLRLLQDDSRNPVNAAAPKLLQSNSVPQKLQHQTTDTFHARAVSDKGDGFDQFGKRINRPNIPTSIGNRSIPAPTSVRNHELNGLGPSKPQFTSTLHAGRNFSMPLNLTTQVQSTPVSQGETMDQVSALPLPLRPQTYDNFMEIQRNMPAGVDFSPNRPKNYRPDNRPRDKSRPRGNSIEITQNRRNQWTAPYGAPNKFAHQSQHNNQQNTSGSMRGSPPKASQPEPIYVRNLQNFQHLQHNSGSSSHTSSQLMGNSDLVSSRMDLPNDARNHKTFQRSTVNQSLDFSPMEGDPNFQRRDDSCLYRYETTPIPRNAHGRTLYLKGPDLKMFCSHQLKDLMSTIGNVVLIKFLLRPHNNGPVFVTFDADVLDAAVKRFDGHQMPDGRLLTAGYPSDNYMRERSGSNSSYNGYHGENHTRFMPNSGLDGRAYARRSSISQHRPSRSQSGQSQFQYPNVHHVTSQNSGNSLAHISDFPNNNSYPTPYAPRQQLQSPRLAIGAVISEVMQHERGIAQFQKQMPLTAMNNRTNSATISHPRSHGGFQGASNRVNTTLETDSAMKNVSSLPGNRKENSPIKSKLTGDSNSTSPSKDSIRNTDTKHKKSSPRRNTPLVTSPIAAPTKSISQVDLNKLDAQKSINHTPEVPSLSEMETSSLPSQMLTTETTVEPEILNLELTKQIPITVPVFSESVNKLLSKDSLETVAMKVSEPVPQEKIKNSRRNKKSKSTNKLSIEKESSSFSSTSAINSPADSQSTSPSHIEEDKLFSGDSTRKQSICSSIESKPNNYLNDAGSQLQADENDAVKSAEGETSAKSLDNEATKFISTTNITSAPNPSDVPAFKSNHKRSKTGGPINGSLSKSLSISAKDLKRLAQSNNSDNQDSSKTPNGSAHKVEHKRVKSQGKNSGGVSSKSSGSQEQLRGDMIKNKAGLPQSSHEKGKSGSEISTKSVDWPALTPSKSPPSSIADGKPPQVFALPALSFRQTKTVILPALPLKPRRQS
ncbi:hypothetical protein MFRU_004g01940 [Monilinia fructicola]|nr:hypothetical protein MFRU_004g01940 [Monilinia fructicola]